MIVLDKLLVSGIGWVLKRVADAASAEMYDESALREELLAAEMKLELGEIDGDEFEEIESQLMDRMRDVRERKKRDAGEPAQQPASGMRYAVDAIEVEIEQEDGKTGGLGR